MCCLSGQHEVQDSRPWIHAPSPTPACQSPPQLRCALVNNSKAAIMEIRMWGAAACHKHECGKMRSDLKSFWWHLGSGCSEHVARAVTSICSSMLEMLLRTDRDLLPCKKVAKHTTRISRSPKPQLQKPQTPGFSFAQWPQCSFGVSKSFLTARCRAR